MPAGSSTFMVCPVCKKATKDPAAPTDGTFYGALAATIALFGVNIGFLIAELSNTIPNSCLYGIPLIILMIFITVGWFFSHPSSHAGYPSGPPASHMPPTSTAQYQTVPQYGQPPTGTQVPVQQYVPQYQQPASPHAAVTYDQGSTLTYQSGGYVAENHCPYCGAVLPPVAPRQVVVCGHCHNQFAT